MQIKSFNDDDWYVIDVATNKVVEHVGCKSFKPVPGPGQIVVTGMRARFMDAT